MTRSADRGAGLISTAAGVVVFLLFVLFAVQLLFALYASSTVTAVANDAAARAASGVGSLELIESDARRNLGRVGERATFTWSLDDTDGDGDGDTVVLEVVADPPRFVPASVGGAVGLDEVRRTVRVRREGFEP